MSATTLEIKAEENERFIDFSVEQLTSVRATAALLLKENRLGTLATDNSIFRRMASFASDQCLR